MRSSFRAGRERPYAVLRRSRGVRSLPCFIRERSASHDHPWPLRGIRTSLAAIRSRSKMHHISSVRGRAVRRTAATNRLTGGHELRSFSAWRSARFGYGRPAVRIEAESCDAQRTSVREAARFRETVGPRVSAEPTPPPSWTALRSRGALVQWSGSWVFTPQRRVRSPRASPSSTPRMRALRTSASKECFE
jgi:hypothetical protein